MTQHAAEQDRAHRQRQLRRHAAEHSSGWFDIKQAVVETGRAPQDLHVYAHRVQIIVPRPIAPTSTKGSTQ